MQEKPLKPQSLATFSYRVVREACTYVTIMQYKKKSSLTLESDIFPHSLQYPGMTFCKVTSLLYCTNSKLCLIIIYE